MGEVLRREKYCTDIFRISPQDQAINILVMNYLSLLKSAHKAVFQEISIESIAAFFSENYVAHTGDKTMKGHKFILQYAKLLHAAIPDLRLQKIEILTQTETTVCYQRKFSGTHKKQLKGISASAEKVTWHEMVVSRFENDKIAEEWVMSDLAFQLMLKLKT